jgi:uncharacterized alpha-E superfamily protein
MRDEAFPRSVRYSVAEAEQCLVRIGPGDGAPTIAIARDLLRSLREDLAAADAKAVVASGLHEYLDGIQTRIEKIHGAIQAAYIDNAREVVGQSQTQS